jgi:hypothetical protein
MQRPQEIDTNKPRHSTTENAHQSIVHNLSALCTIATIPGVIYNGTDQIYFVWDKSKNKSTTSSRHNVVNSIMIKANILRYLVWEW